MSIDIDVEGAGWDGLPGLEGLARQVMTAALPALGMNENSVAVSILFTDDESIARINGEWRGKDYATNVLSFPAENMPLPPGEPQPLGDIVLASGVVAREAEAQGKTLRDHTIHLMIHGLLHLAGYDHEDDKDAAVMEALETQILKGLGISDPYE